jgi:hypothetical protein
MTALALTVASFHAVSTPLHTYSIPPIAGMEGASHGATSGFRFFPRLPYRSHVRARRRARPRARTREISGMGRYGGMDNKGERNGIAG